MFIGRKGRLLKTVPEKSAKSLPAEVDEVDFLGFCSFQKKEQTEYIEQLKEELLEVPSFLHTNRFFSPPKLTASLQLKMDGWMIHFPFFGFCLFSGANCWFEGG